jgi:hypothetical protein
MKPMLKLLKIKRLKQKNDVRLLSRPAFKFNLRRYTLASSTAAALALLVGWCRLAASKPELKEPMVSALETQHHKLLSTVALNLNLRRYILAAMLGTQAVAVSGYHSYLQAVAYTRPLFGST